MGPFAMSGHERRNRTRPGPRYRRDHRARCRDDDRRRYLRPLRPRRQQRRGDGHRRGRHRHGRRPVTAFVYAEFAAIYPEAGGDADVPVDGIVRAGHHVEAAIPHTITQHESDAVLLGWRGQSPRRRNVVVGSTVDTVVREVDCDVLIERIGTGDGDIDTILLPTAGGPHARYAAAVARVIMAERDLGIDSRVRRWFAWR
jgi:hypothetical protein